MINDPQGDYCTVLEHQAIFWYGLPAHKRNMLADAVVVMQKNHVSLNA